MHCLPVVLKRNATVALWLPLLMNAHLRGEYFCKEMITQKLPAISRCAHSDTLDFRKIDFDIVMEKGCDLVKQSFNPKGTRTMADQTWHYLENQFDSVTKGNRKLMHAILKDHYGKLSSEAATNPAVQPLLDDLQPVYADWGQKYGDWKSAQTTYGAATVAFQNQLEALQQMPPGDGRSRIDEWASKIASYWTPGSQHYSFLLPRGREPFTTGSRDEIVEEVQRFAARLGVKETELTQLVGQPGNTPEQTADYTEQAAAMSALEAKVNAFYAKLNGARTAQTEKGSQVEQLSGQVRNARVATAEALYRNLAGLMRIFYKADDRPRVTEFFDLGMIMNPPAPSDNTPDAAVTPAAVPPAEAAGTGTK